MTAEEYGDIASALETALKPFRKNAAELKVSEIRVRADLEAVYADFLKLALRQKAEESLAPFQVVRMHGGFNDAS